jgi:cell division control protein 24
VYQEELIAGDLVSRDVIHAIFSSTTELLDFQRRFLIALEGTLSLGSTEQRVGAVFIQHEDGFNIYTRICGNYAQAIQTALENAEVLSKASKVDPVRHLQSMLIKPVQRICRYPMLLKVPNHF